MTRPVGITVLAIVALVWGIFHLLLTLLGLAGLGLAASGVASQYSTGTLVYASVSDFVLGALFLAFGIGALRLRGWAWTTGVVALGLTVVAEIVSFVHGRDVLLGIVTVVASLLALWYLLRANVRLAFGRAA